MRKWHYIAAASILILAAAWLIYGYERGKPAPVNRDEAAWIWDLPELVGSDGSKTGEAADFLRKHRIRTVYLYTGSKATGEQQTLYRSFIQAASNAGAEVQALGGERNWVLAGGRQGLLDFMRQVAAYNDSAPENARFSGLHLDVEPYLLPEWDKDPNGVVRQWEEMMDQASEFARGRSLELGVDLPFWLDDIPASASADGESGESSETLDQWMMAKADSITLMSYRNEAEGSDGAIALVRQELRHAKAVGGRVFVGLNAAPDEQPKLTFYGTSAERLEQVAARIQREFAGNGGFGGIAVHDLAAWMRLERA